MLKLKLITLDTFFNFLLMTIEEREGWWFNNMYGMVSQATSLGHWTLYKSLTFWFRNATNADYFPDNSIT